MTAIEIARRFAELGETEEAQKAYMVFLYQKEEKDPKEELEAASYIFFSHGNYEVAYTSFVSLYNRGLFQEELMNLILQAFYLPNVEKLKKQYEENCRVLEEYPYFFRQEFPDFDDLPVLFFPFDEKGFLPFYQDENRFGEYVNFNRPVIDRYFFKDLEKPIFAEDVYSQYQLEYLNDNVRKSEWVARENHIYLHYTHWKTFCSHLQCLALKKLLKDEKFVFLIEEEGSQYPIDFKERFGIDYSQYPVKPIGIQEVNRMIWHTQLSSHNGGDFFNEIFYGHPNLLAYESLMFESISEMVKGLRKKRRVRDLNDSLQRELAQIPNPTYKDCLVAYFLNNEAMHRGLDPNSRIAPALFFQPHFYNILCELHLDEKQKYAVLSADSYEEVKRSPIFRQFKYIKTFTPMRRITTSYGATVRFMLNMVEEASDNAQVVNDAFTQRLLNRTFMADPDDRLYQDSVLVRFEDGKLNPKATFTALAEFLDIPYTESMTYCSGATGINPESLKGNDLGFDPAAIYRTYDDYVNDDDRAILEYFMRDAYQHYGYDFHYYKGGPVDEAWVEEKLKGMHHLDSIIEKTHFEYLMESLEKQFAVISDGKQMECEKDCREAAQNQVKKFAENRKNVLKVLLRDLQFINSQGQPLQLMKPLQLDPELLEQPLYH